MRLGDFIQKEIVIPCYQRGYIWGKKHPGTEHNAVTFMLDSLKKGVEPEKICSYKASQLWIKAIVMLSLTANSG